MIADFGLVVEKIEGKKFTPPPVERLTTKDEGEKNIFAVNVCRNCDARFSCESFRTYVRTKDKGKNPLRRYLDDYGTENDADEFLDANLDQTKLETIITTIQEG